MTTRPTLPTRLLALTLALLVPLAACDLGAPAASAPADALAAAPRTRPYTPLLETEDGRAMAIAHLNGGVRHEASARSDELVAQKGFRAGGFGAPSDAFATARAGDGTTKRASTVPAAALAVSLPSAALADPGLTPALLSALTGQPESSFAAFAKPPEPEGGPRLFEAQAWADSDAPLLVALGSGALPSSPLPGPTVVGNTGPGNPPRSSADGYLDASMHLLRYACCEGIGLRADATDDADVIATLSEGQLVWLLDLTPSTGLASVIEDIEQCQENGDCRSAVTQIATLSNVDYYAKIFVPGLGLTGYVDFPALFVRPVNAKPGEVVLENGFDRIAKTLRTGLETRFQGGGCGDPGSSVSVSAPPTKDLHYDPTSQTKRTCDDALECPDWKVASCADLGPDDEGFDACIYASVAECGGSKPDRDPSDGLVACVRNVCPGKGTCGTCREWFEATGQDETGWQTETDLVNNCAADMWANKPDPNDADAPIECIGDDSCVTYCQQTLQTEWVAGCQRYISKGDSRSYADPTDYECGEIPIAETHPNFWFYSNIGEWSGEPDYAWKRLAGFDLFHNFHPFELARLGSQQPISFSTPDLTDGGAAHPESLGAELTARNVWLSIQPGVVDEDVFDWLNDGQRSALFVNTCIHVPGVSFRGPDMDYDPDDTPFFLISHIDFGDGSVDRADLCGLAAATLDDDLDPDVRWLDASFQLAGIEYGGVEINKGPGFWLLAAASNLVPAVGEILAHVVLAAVFAEEVIEGLVNNTDLDSWLADFLLRAYETKVTGKLLDELNDQTGEVLADLDLGAGERLATVCTSLDPDVTSSHPYYWFYLHLKRQCERAVETASIDPIVANPASEEHACYGAQQLFTPDDAGRGLWWQQYAGQEWYFWFVPDQGCRVGSHVEATLDQATWPVLRCATAVSNAWWNRGMIGGTSGLAGMLKDSCTETGLLSLEDLYGDGSDVAELWKHNHGGSGDELSPN